LILWAFLCAYKVGVQIQDGIRASAKTELARMLEGVGRLHEWLIRQAEMNTLH
jgi:hypothetical protein